VATRRWKKIEDTFIHLDRIHERDRQTDTARRHRPRLCIASRGKNCYVNHHTALASPATGSGHWGMHVLPPPLELAHVTNDSLSVRMLNTCSSLHPVLISPFCFATLRHVILVSSRTLQLVHKFLSYRFLCGWNNISCISHRLFAFVSVSFSLSFVRHLVTSSLQLLLLPSATTCENSCLLLFSFNVHILSLDAHFILFFFDIPFCNIGQLLKSEIQRKTLEIWKQ